MPIYRDFDGTLADTEGNEAPDSEYAPLTELPCYLCERNLEDDEPVRKIVKEFVCNPADPTQVYKLDCGHTII